VTAVVARLPARDRQRLLARIRELEDIDRIIRQPGAVRPPEPPRPLAGIAKEEA